jgi:hypothetical protein
MITLPAAPRRERRALGAAPSRKKVIPMRSFEVRESRKAGAWRVLVAVPGVVVACAGCLLTAGPRGTEVEVAPPMPEAVELGDDPYFSQGGYYYYYQGDRWSYASRRDGPWIELPRERYPREVTFHGQIHQRGQEPGRVEMRGQDENRARVEARVNEENHARAEERAKADERARADERNKTQERAKADERNKTQERAKADERGKAQERAKADERGKAQERAKADNNSKGDDRGHGGDKGDESHQPH